MTPGDFDGGGDETEGLAGEVETMQEALFAAIQDYAANEVGAGILNAGAYGFTMSSQYNSRPRAAEVLIKDKKSFLVRKRETFDSLLLNQHLEE